MKAAFMFSGQGAQTAGMGKELYHKYDEVKSIFNTVSEELSYDIAEICFTKNDKLNQTEYCQPALLTVGMAAYTVLSKTITPVVMMGLSLGEYTALTAARSFDIKTAVRLVARRGALMSSASGVMSAVLGLPLYKVLAICDKIDGVYVANYNTFEQIVVAGNAGAVAECEAEAKGSGGRCMRLKVCGPFHTPYLDDISAEFNKTLSETTVNTPRVPVITNVTGELLPMDTGKIMDNLKAQMTSKVLWVNAIETALDMGVDTFIELGAGKTLCGFAKSICAVKNINVDIYTAEGIIWERR